MDYPKLIKEKEQEFLGLTGRMDDDRKLLYLDKYIMKDARGKKVKDVVNVTLNKPGVFASNVISALNSTRQQIVCESDDSKVKTAEIEQFVNLAFSSANARIVSQGKATLNFFTDTQSCIRGRAARRVLFRVEDGVIIPDIASLDTRFHTYDVGENGLAWSGYKTYRSKGDIEAEYGIVTDGKFTWVSDVWDAEHNEVWVGNQRISRNKDGTERIEEHAYGITPVVLQIVPLGYGNILLDDDRLMYEGESIFFMIRDLVPQLNMWISILQTLNLKTVKGPAKQKKKGGGEPEEYDEVMGMGAITAIDVDEDIARIDYGDAIRATSLVYQAIEKAMQEGSYTDIDIGNVKQPFSAVALITIGESKDQVYLPRLASREMLNKATAEMLIRQVRQESKALGTSIKMGTPGHKKGFNVSDLEGEYEITFKSFLKSPKTDIARMAVATQAERYYDPVTILEDVLQVEDPKAIMRKRYYFMAEKIDANILRHRIIMNLVEMAEDGDENAAYEAQIMAVSMGLTLDQIKSGQVMPTVPTMSGNGEQPTEPIVSLLGKGGSVGGIPRAAIGSASPEEEGTE